VDRTADRVSPIVSAADPGLNFGATFPSARAKTLPQHLGLNSDRDDMRAWPSRACGPNHASGDVEYRRAASFEVFPDCRGNAVAQTMGAPVKEKSAIAPQTRKVPRGNVNMLLACLIGARDES
jgi:hypothetical protein